jgi:hypothetical protein
MSPVSPTIESFRAVRVVRYVTAAAIGLVWSATLWFAARHWMSLYDDAYIYFRYVENIRSGCGLRYNCADPPVEGFTSPLYLGLLTLCRLVTPELETVAQSWGILAVAATGTVAILTVSRSLFDQQRSAMLVPATFGCALLMASDHYWLLNSVIGLETPLASLAALLVLRAALLGQHHQLRAWVVVAVLCRPECLLFVPALAVFREARNVRYFLWPAAVLTALLLLRVLVFDELVPNTYLAKSGGTARHLVLGIQYIGDTGRDFPMTLLAPLALLDARIRRAAGYYLLVTLFWYAFFLRSGGDTFYYSRLAVPLVPGLEVLAVLGSFTLGSRLGRSTRLAWAWSIVTPSLVLGMVSLRAALAHSIEPQHGFANVKRYQAVGRYLRQHHPGATVATVPIGAIGYFSGARVLDLVGLTAPAIAQAGTTVPVELLERKWIGHERHNTDWVLAQAPDLIVTTKYRDRPWTSLADTSAGFIADWLLLRAIKAGQTRYRLLSAEVSPGVHWLMFQRASESAEPPPLGASADQ